MDKGEKKTDGQEVEETDRQEKKKTEERKRVREINVRERETDR